MSLSWLPPISLHVQNAASWPAQVHPLTSLHQAVWEFEKLAQDPSFSDLDLAKKIHALTEQKLAYYNTRFGFILKVFSAFINLCKYRSWEKFISAGHLGNTLAKATIERLEQAQIKAAEEKRIEEMQTRLKKALNSFWPGSNALLEFLDPNLVTDFKQISDRNFCIEFSKPIQRKLQIGDRTVFFSFPKMFSFNLFSPKGEGMMASFPENSVCFNTDVSGNERVWLPGGTWWNYWDFEVPLEGFINSLMRTDDVMQITYTIAGIENIAEIPLSDFAQALLQNRPVVQPAATPLTTKTPLEDLEDTFRAFWPMESQHGFLVDFWSKLLKDREITKFQRNGSHCVIELDRPSKIKCRTVSAGTTQIKVPFAIDIAQKLEFEIVQVKKGYPNIKFGAQGLTSCVVIQDLQACLAQISALKQKKLFLKELNVLLKATPEEEITEAALMRDINLKLSPTLYAASWATNVIKTRIETMVLTPSLAILSFSFDGLRVLPNTTLTDTFSKLLGKFEALEPIED